MRMGKNLCAWKDCRWYASDGTCSQPKAAARSTGRDAKSCPSCFEAR